MTGRVGKFRSVILAGERPGGSPLSRHFSVAASVLVPVGGQPSLARVMQAIDDSHQASSGVICGPASDVIEHSNQLAKLLHESGHAWLEPASGPAASALAALRKLDHFPTLLTAGDHALLSGEIVDAFCKRVLALRSRYDIVIGFVPYRLVKAAWPESRRTVLKFSDGGYCGSNLFAILNPSGGRALDFWRQVEADRKHPWRIARRLGPIALLRFLFRRLTLQEALLKLSEVAGCRIGHVELDYARAAVDVDSIEDQKLAERILMTPN